MIKSKKFINAVENLTIFIDKKNEKGQLENIFLKGYNKELDTLFEQYDTIWSEVENIRKRSEKERVEAYKVGISLFVKDFVPVLDNIERALSSIKDSEEVNYESFVEGIKATDKDIINLLEKPQRIKNKRLRY